MSQIKYLVTMLQYDSLDSDPIIRQLGTYDTAEIAESIAQGYRDGLANNLEGVNLSRYMSLSDIEFEVTPVEDNAPLRLPVSIFIGFANKQERKDVREMLTSRAEKIFAIYVDPTTGLDVFNSLPTGRAPSVEAVRDALSNDGQVFFYEWIYSTLAARPRGLTVNKSRMAFSANLQTLEEYLNKAKK